MIRRLFGVSLNNKKPLKLGLTDIYGIGRTLALKICNDLDLNSNLLIDNLSSVDLDRIKIYIEQHIKIENELKREERRHISRLKNIRCYRGIRHSIRLPLRGQRTRTNAKTQRKFKR